MGTCVVTGSASGLGAAVRTRLELAGHRVVGVDLRGAEVVADLSDPGGRETALAMLHRTAPELDGVVAAAGLGPQVDDRAALVAVNYFGAVATLDGLHGALAAGTRPAAVAVSSNSASTLPADPELIAACLAGDEEAARARAASLEGIVVYATSKLALIQAVRRRVETWAAAGVRLNAVAPGPFRSALLDATLADPQLGPAVESFPVPLGRVAETDEIAAVVTFLLGPEASFVHGSVLFADGGSDALLRPDGL